MEVADNKKELDNFILKLYNELPENVAKELFVDVDEEWIEPANVIFSNGAFQVQTQTEGIFYAFAFSNDKSIVEYSSITQDVIRSNRTKRQCTLTNEDGIYCVSVKESDMDIYNDQNRGIENTCTNKKQFDNNGNLLNQTRKVSEQLNCEGTIQDLVNKPFIDEKELIINNSYHKEYQVTYQKAM